MENKIEQHYKKNQVSEKDITIAVVAAVVIVLVFFIYVNFVTMILEHI